MNRHWISLLIFCLLLAAAQGDAAEGDTAELRGGDVTIQVDRGGCGFLDRIALAGHEVVAARPGFVGASVTLAAAGEGTADSLFTSQTVAVLPARISSLSAVEGKLTVEGTYTDGKVAIPFTRELLILSEKDAVAVREQADFSRLPGEYVIAEHSLELPLVVCKDEHLRMFAFGGRRRVEMFRMDMNDERRRNQNLSDNRAFWPYWDIGGVLQLSDSYHIWRANHADTIAYPVEDGRGGPGWADYSDPERGITAEVPGAEAAAPWAMCIDARKGVFSIAPHPASQMPVAGRDYGKRDFRFQLLLHESSWPATYPCELDLDLYKEFLIWLNRGGRYTHLDYICGRIGVMVPEGEKTPQQLEDACRRIIFKQRIQPSVLLRLLYRGDAWRMGGLVQEVLGKSVPRNQPIEKWEEVAREFFAKIRADGLPKPATRQR